MLFCVEELLWVVDQGSPCFYWNGRFITIIRRAQHWSLSQSVYFISSQSVSLISILILSSHHLSRSFSKRFCTLFLSCMPHFLAISSSFSHHKNMKWRVKVPYKSLNTSTCSVKLCGSLYYLYIRRDSGLLELQHRKHGTFISLHAFSSYFLSSLSGLVLIFQSWIRHASDARTGSVLTFNPNFFPLLFPCLLPFKLKS